MKRTLKRELKELEIVEIEAFAFSGCLISVRLGGRNSPLFFLFTERMRGRELPKSKPSRALGGLASISGTELLDLTNCQLLS